MKLRLDNGALKILDNSKIEADQTTPKSESDLGIFLHSPDHSQIRLLYLILHWGLPALISSESSPIFYKIVAACIFQEG
jgi:hypothetical protein